MTHGLLKWISPPVFPDDRDLTRRAAALNVMLVTLLALMPVLVIGNLLGGRVPPFVYGVNAGMFTVCLALRAWMRRGAVVPAGWWLLALGILAVTASLARLGTVRAPTAAMYPLIIITAGLLTGLLGMIIVIVLCAVAVVGLIGAADAGLLSRPDLSTGVTQAFTYTAIFAWTGGLMYAAIQSLRKAVVTAELELDARVRAEEELEQHLARLEETVQERTTALSLVNTQLRAQIDERARTEEALRESERKFATAFRSSPDAIILTRLAEGVIIEVNEGFCAMSGFARDEIIGDSTIGLRLWLDENERARAVAALATTGGVRGLELRFRRKDGEVFTGLFSASLIQLGEERCVLSTIRDISDRKQLELERERLIDTLQATLAQVKTLTGILPICMHCKKIRDDQGYWSQVEAFVTQHSEAEFSHGICPDCLREHYPDEL